MRTIRVLALTAAVVAIGVAGCDDDEPTAPPVETYAAAMNGANEVAPPALVATSATGTATITVNGNLLTYTLTTTGFAAGTTAPAGGTALPAHIHNGAAGVNGGIMVNLTSNLNASASGTVTVVDSVLAKMRTGNAYVNVHTNNRSAGEIRGQLVRTQ
jgi:trimeric autotransporter adhesin